MIGPFFAWNGVFHRTHRRTEGGNTLAVCGAFRPASHLVIFFYHLRQGDPLCPACERELKRD